MAGVDVGYINDICDELVTLGVSEAAVAPVREWAKEQPRKPRRVESANGKTYIVTTKEHCLVEWPDCEDGAYNPHCCRFPKSCSCDTYTEVEA